MKKQAQNKTIVKRKIKDLDKGKKYKERREKEMLLNSDYSIFIQINIPIEEITVSEERLSS